MDFGFILFIIVAIVLNFLGKAAKSQNPQQNKSRGAFQSDSSGNAANRFRDSRSGQYTQQSRQSQAAAQGSTAQRSTAQRSNEQRNSAQGSNGQRGNAQRSAASSRQQTGTTTAAVREKARANANTTIVERAKANNSKLAEDATLQEIERTHGHSEKQEQIHEEHSRNCRTLAKDAAASEVQESIFGSTEDLIVKGFSGNLTFDRDFIGEGMDMLAAISVPDGSFHGSEASKQ